MSAVDTEVAYSPYPARIVPQKCVAPENVCSGNPLFSGDKGKNCGDNFYVSRIMPNFVL